MIELYYLAALIAVLGLLLDLLLGEPPNALHPVVWIGKTIWFFDKRTKRTSPAPIASRVYSWPWSHCCFSLSRSHYYWH